MISEPKITRVKLAKFVKANREHIRTLTIEADIKSSDLRNVVEVGRLVNESLELGPSFGQRLKWTDHWEVTPDYPYPTLAQLWFEADPMWRYGILHTHPNFPGNDSLGLSDLDMLERPDCFLIMAATLAGGHYQLIAAFDSEEGTQHEKFDLYPKATLIARWLAGLLHLAPWQLILADRDGDGKVTIKDALLATRERISGVEI